MTPQDFVYWLNGFVELGGDRVAPSEEQWKSICEHLKLTMNKVTPPLLGVGFPVTKIETTPAPSPKWIQDVIDSINKQLDKKADKIESGGTPIPAVPFNPSVQPYIPTTTTPWTDPSTTKTTFPFYPQDPIIRC